MAIASERNWTAHVVIASDHAGLKPQFKRLEAEIYRVLARLDDPRQVRRYLTKLFEVSEAWLSVYEREQRHK